MNKKLLTAAIAAAIAAPTAALANDVTIYGVIHASVDYRTDEWSARGTAVDGFGDWGDPDDRFSFGTKDYGSIDGFDIASRATRIGFKGSEDLANGLKAIWKIEAQADIADRGGVCASGLNLTGVPYGTTSPTLNQGTAGSGLNWLNTRAKFRMDVAEGQPSGVSPVVGNPVCDSGDWWTARNAYIGLAGGWGTFLVGRHDTPYKMSTGKLDLFADTLADYNSNIGFVDLRTNSAIAYVSPSWSGLSFAGAVVAPHTYLDSSYDADSLAEAYSLAITYDNYGFFASVAYENVSEDWVASWAGPYLFSSSGAGWDPAYTITGLGDNEKWRFGLGWTGAGFTIGGIYEMEDNMIGFDQGTDGTRWQIQAGYTFGNNMIKAMYGQGDFDTGWQCFDCVDYSGPNYVDNADKMDGDSTAWAIGLDHNFSKRTKAYVLYSNVEYTTNYTASRDGFFTDGWETRGKGKVDGDAGGFSIGMVHSF